MHLPTGRQRERTNTMARPVTTRASCVILMTLAMCASRSVAAPPTIPTTAPTTGPSAYIVTRADVAKAYLELDRLYIKSKLSDEDRARVNHKFDEATILYFRKQQSDSVRMIEELIDTLVPESSKTLEARVARAMRVRVAPWVAQERRPTPLRVKITPLYAVPIE